MANTKRNQSTVAVSESKQLFVGWLKQNKNGANYISALTSTHSEEVLGIKKGTPLFIYANTYEKKKANSPDYFGYYADDFKNPILALWKKKSAKGLVYLSGSYGRKDEPKTYVTGFFNLDANGKKPYINIILSESKKDKSDVKLDLASPEMPF